MPGRTQDEKTITRRVYNAEWCSVTLYGVFFQISIRNGSEVELMPAPAEPLYNKTGLMREVKYTDLNGKEWTGFVYDKDIICCERINQKRVYA